MPGNPMWWWPPAGGEYHGKPPGTSVFYSQVTCGSTTCKRIPILLLLGLLLLSRPPPYPPPACSYLAASYATEAAGCVWYRGSPPGDVEAWALGLFLACLVCGPTSHVVRAWAGGLEAMPQLPGEGGWHLHPPSTGPDNPLPLCFEIVSPLNFPACRQSMPLSGSFPATAGGRLPVLPMWLPVPTWEGKEAPLAPISLACGHGQPAPNVATT